ncbi:hypothetical protein FOA52_006623 [Chlamydomonas sp. UWO 241]|nr:hypothetical protein FOA52_006623 [Chlamydomonas sp. UWO 241]
MYTRDDTHKEWVLAGPLTVIHVKLLARRQGMFVHGAESFECVANVHNDVHDVMPGRDRRGLYRKRLEEGMLRYWMQATVHTYAPHLMDVLNLNMALDVQLDIVHEVVMLQLARRAAQHAQTQECGHPLAGKFMMLDGHAKVAHQRCSQKLGVEDAELQQLRDSTTYALGRYCINTPSRASKRSYCIECEVAAAFEAATRTQPGVATVAGEAEEAEADEKDAREGSPAGGAQSPPDRIERVGAAIANVTAAAALPDAQARAEAKSMLDAIAAFEREAAHETAHEAALAAAAATANAAVGTTDAGEDGVQPDTSSQIGEAGLQGGVLAYTSRRRPLSLPSLPPSPQPAIARETAQPKEVEVREQKLNRRTHEVLYLVRYDDELHSWETCDNVADGLVTALQQSQRRGRALEFANLDEDDDFLKEEPAEVEMEAAVQATYNARAPAGGTRSCKPRIGTLYDTYTGGGLWAFCACGCTLGVMELPQAEETRMVVLFLLRLFPDGLWAHPDGVGGEKFCIGFDDACHLERFLAWHVAECAEENGKRARAMDRLQERLHAALLPGDADELRARLAELEATPDLDPHPMLHVLLDETDIAWTCSTSTRTTTCKCTTLGLGADYSQNAAARCGPLCNEPARRPADRAHTLSQHNPRMPQGAYCNKHCNPHDVKLLEATRVSGKRNMSVAEQCCSKLSRHRFSLNNMNRQRFQFMLMVIMKLDVEA